MNNPNEWLDHAVDWDFVGKPITRRDCIVTQCGDLALSYVEAALTAALSPTPTEAGASKQSPAGGEGLSDEQIGLIWRHTIKTSDEASVAVRFARAVIEAGRGSDGAAPQPLSEPLFLVCAGGDGYSSQIVPESKLDEAYLLTQWCTLDSSDAEDHKAALEHFHDPDEWLYMDPLRGGKDRVAVEFSLSLEDGWVRVVRLLDGAEVTRRLGRGSDGAVQAAPPTPTEPAVQGEPSDTQRLDWLERQVVNVRTPMRYGSLQRFLASPDEEEQRSDLRSRIDAALARPLVAVEAGANHLGHSASASVPDAAAQTTITHEAGKQ